MIGEFRDEYFFMSNFYEAPVTYGGITYRNTEAAFQAQKTLSPEERHKFADMSPTAAKRAGRKVALRPDWETVKFTVMYEVCRAKFEQHPELAEQLLATGTEELVEGNTWGDRIWGQVNGKGQNNLGKILMRIRDELGAGENKEEQKMKVLVVIDMQRDFTTGVLGNPQTAAVTEPVAERIRAFRAENPDGILVATMDTHGANYMETQEGRNLPVPHCIEGTDGWELEPAVAEALGGKEIRVKKGTFGAKNLPEIIEKVGIPDEIEIIGVCTDICVISNAMILKAAFPEVPITVRAACCAGVTPESHENALNALRVTQFIVV